MSVRNVTNYHLVEDYELPVGAGGYIVQAATPYMEGVFPDQYEFDVDWYLAP